MINTDESAYTGSRSLKFVAKHVEPGENVFVYKKTHYRPADFHDSRYDPCFSPLVYPGQIIHGSAMIPEYGEDALVLSLIHIFFCPVFPGSFRCLQNGLNGNLSGEQAEAGIFKEMLPFLYVCRAQIAVCSGHDRDGSLAVPVSYTHLDVYKRQGTASMWEFPSVRVSACTVL